MLKNRIIPCLDVKNGRVVKGINFVELKDAGDPVEQAKIYSDSGAAEICFVDISASNEVSSNRIAHASITYTGAGDLHDTNQPGWLVKALRVVSPF